LEIPVSNPNATHFGISVAVTAIWNLRENLRYLLALHREGQRAFAKQTAETEGKAQKKTAAQANARIVQIKA
jgi:hypothetical protein